MANPLKQSEEQDLNNRIFVCDEESNFYSYCIESLVMRNNNLKNSREILEFGSGDGTPVINAILRNDFNGLIQGFEINPEASAKARENIKNSGINSKYIIYEKSFFELSSGNNFILISNPPYLPASDNNIRLPALFGGEDGITPSKKLIDTGYENIMLMVSSYSNPVSMIEYARAKGYLIEDFLIMPMPFGYYSSEPKVQDRIAEMKAANTAFFSPNRYLLAGVLFSKRQAGNNLTTELLKILTSI